MKQILLLTSLLISLCLSANNIANAATIASDKTAGCAPLSVHFSGTTSDKNAKWLWDFGNGKTSEEKAPEVFFLQAGVYQVKLSLNGTAAGIKTITVNAAPNVNFTIDKNKACVNEPLNFTNTSTSSNSSIVKSIWGFGDGKASTESNAQHGYTTSGNYNVTLVVTDANGCSADKTSYSSIAVSPIPQADFKPSVSGSCSEKQDVWFSNLSSGNKLNYAWSFGDGNTSEEMTPSHLFLQGKHNVSLTVKDINECTSTKTSEVSVTKLKVDFLTSNETPSMGEPVKFYSTSNYKGNKWLWDFGDGTVSVLHSPEKVYSAAGNYSVKFTLYDGECNETVTRKSYIQVIQATPVSFTSNVTSSCSSPMSVKFRNTTPNAALLLWEFGDGTVSTNANPEKVFNSPGNYKVTLSVTDSSGYTVKKGVDNYIQSAKPQVRFGGDTFGCAGYPVKFNNFTPNATSYLWSFGDGETSTKKSPTHVYKKNGFYSVSLTANNGELCDSTITLSNYVHIDTVKADFEMVATKSVVPPFVCTFSNTTSPKANMKYIWDFGDGTTETSANPVHIYDIPGNFNVRLVAYTKSGCSSVKTLQTSFQMGAALNNAVILEGE
ncbi:MAG: PKD domain-containing protein [Bacteroidota bacterium]